MVGASAASTYAARTLLQHQAAVARRLIGKPHGEDAVDADRVWRKSYGDPVDLLLLGDSIAAGLGAERRKDTLGGRLARGLAKQTHRVPVADSVQHLRCNVASSGGCWFRVGVNFDSGSSVNDSTTWTAKIEGEPVRLIE